MGLEGSAGVIDWNMEVCQVGIEAKSITTLLTRDGGAEISIWVETPTMVMEMAVALGKELSWVDTVVGNCSSSTCGIKSDCKRTNGRYALDIM